MVLLRKTLYLILSLAVVLPAHAKQAKPAPLSVEQNRQFMYYWYAARQAITAERYPEAFALLEFCHALNPEDGQTLAFLGVMYDALGDKARAEEAFAKAYETDPAHQWYRYLEPRKQQFIEQQQWKKALATQDEIDKRRGFYDAYSALTRYRIYRQWGKPKKAVAAIDRYLETDPENLRFLYLKLELMEQTGAKPKAMFAMYDRILELDPYNLMILNNYAYLLCTNGGDLAEAERMSAVTIREEPDNPVFLDTYGWILHLKGKDDLALFFLQRAETNADGQTKEVIVKHIKAIKK